MVLFCSTGSLNNADCINYSDSLILLGLLGMGDSLSYNVLLIIPDSLKIPVLKLNQMIHSLTML